MSSVARCGPPDLTDVAPPRMPGLTARDKTVSNKCTPSQLANPRLPNVEQPSLRESRSNLSTARQHSKKKNGGVLGFLRLKEPSIAALKDFAALERRQTAQKASRAATIGMSGTSSQTLPEHVPKVNSKWNGLPEPLAAKNRNRNHQNGEKNVAGARSSVSSYCSTTSQPNHRTRLATGDVDVHGSTL